MREASPLLRAEFPRLRAASRLGAVVDLACGRGRHSLAVARQGLAVLALDRNPAFLSELAKTARDEGLAVAPARADLESGHAIPVHPGSCGAVLVFRYLFRPLAGAIEALLAPGGLLLYETFTIHQKDLAYGPSNEAFLLRPGELPTLFPALQVHTHWEGTTPGPKPWALARLAASKSR